MDYLVGKILDDAMQLIGKQKKALNKIENELDVRTDKHNNTDSQGLRTHLQSTPVRKND